MTIFMVSIATPVRSVPIVMGARVVVSVVVVSGVVMSELMMSRVVVLEVVVSVAMVGITMALPITITIMVSPAVCEAC